MPRPATVDPIIEKVVKYLRDDVGVQRIGGVGYCFGGKYVVRWLKGNESGLDAGYVAHPSFVDREEVEGVKGPLSIAAAREYILNILTRFMEGDCECGIANAALQTTETDNIFTTAQRHETEETLGKMSVPWQINVYSDTEHGFAVKGHLGTAKARFAKERAFEQAVGWFGEYLENS